MAESGGNPRIYDMLVSLRPAEISSNNAWALRAGVNRNVFNDLRAHGRPRRETLEKLLDVAGVSPAQFEAMIAPERAEGAPESHLASPFTAFRGHDRPKDVPVLGTPACGEMVVRVEGEEIVVETIDVDLDEVIEFVRRPVGIDPKREVYAIYPQGFSMAPRVEPGEIQYVDARKPPAIGDYVVVQLRRADDQAGERIVSSLLKRLVRQSPDWVELEQFNPAAVFRVDRRRIAKIHRIMTLNELVGF